MKNLLQSVLVLGMMFLYSYSFSNRRIRIRRSSWNTNYSKLYLDILINGWGTNLNYVQV